MPDDLYGDYDANRTPEFDEEQFEKCETCPARMRCEKYQAMMDFLNAPYPMSRQ